MEFKTGEVTASIEELAVCTMLLSKAVYKILADKGVVTKGGIDRAHEEIENGNKDQSSPP